MFKFFNNNRKANKIRKWSQTIWKLVNQNEELKAKIDQIGILDGNVIVSEFIDHAEYKLAIEHLIYMIQESGVYLNESDIDELTQLALDFGIPKPNLATPTLLEIEEFYVILELFNIAQEKVVKTLENIWQLKTPITNSEWVPWSQNLYEKNQFSNNESIKIFPHGYGLRFQDKNLFIDFDFGDEGEISGFDSYRLWQFISANQIKTLFTEKDQIDRVIKDQTNKEKLYFSGYLNYYKHKGKTREDSMK